MVINESRLWGSRYGRFPRFPAQYNAGGGYWVALGRDLNSAKDGEVVRIMNTGEQYDEDYFLRGKQTGKSLYEYYRWMPDLTVPMVCTIIQHLGIDIGDSILDFGCARGYVVRAFRDMDYNAWGYDISGWAVDNADETVRDKYVSNDPDILTTKFDWIIAKDVLEHVDRLWDTIGRLMRAAKKGIFVVVPLSEVDDGRYVVREYEKDVTHIHRLTLWKWAGLFTKPGWVVESTYRIKGIKDNYAQYATGNGFVTARRMAE